MEKDLDKSTRAKRLVRARVGQCYLSAFRLVQQIPEYANAEYVEGMAVNRNGMAFEHGWVEKDGVIVDPTLPANELMYFPGLRFKGQRGLSKALKIPKPKHTKDDLPIFYRFGWGGIESPEFRSALIGAYRFNGSENLAKRYENYEPGSGFLSA